MNDFSYKKADSVDTAVKASQNRTSKIIAGGTNLVDLMKYRVENPSEIIDITKLALETISQTDDGGIRLGALATNADTAYHAQVAHNYPMLAQAILSGASAQLRNKATDGGNLMQRTRCYYFYDTTTPCNKREPGSGCSAINGFNRIHAILGTSEQCIATHPSDMCVALAALDAKVNITGPSGDRSMSILDFHRLPGDKPEKDNNLNLGDVVTSIDLPAKGFKSHSAYLKIRDRESYAFALVSVAAAIEIENESIKEIRVALGGVAHKPWRKVEVEQKYIGKSATEENFLALAEDLLAGAKGFGDNDFKIVLAKRAIVRALLTAKSKTVK
ncbi:MAG: xanthine dehydrogenase family protein subunit M [Leeuwenhoekiella sp.]